MGIIRGIIRSSKKLALATSLLLLGVAVACSSSSDDGGDGSPSKLIPVQASVVGSVSINQALDAIEMDQFFDSFSSGLAGEEKGFNKFFNIDQLKEGGLFGDISRVDIFGEITDGDDLEYFGTLLVGSFEEAKLIADLEAAAGRNLVQKDYKGTNIYSPEDDPDEYYLSILDGSTFALGTGGAINDIIDIKVGDAESASGPLIDTFNELSDGLFALALKMPEDLGEDADLGEVPGLGDLPISLEFVSSLDIVGLSGKLNGAAIDVVVTLELTDEDAAESLEGFINGLVSLASGFLTDPEVSGLLGDLDVARVGSRVTMEIAVPLEDIPDLFGDLTSDSSVETSSANARPPGTPEIRPVSAGVGVEVPILGSDHVNEGVKVEYNSTPPTSGEHWPRWADCGFYSESLPDERIVHNLEHGNIVVSYNFTNPAQVTALREALRSVREFADWGVARPYDEISDGQVALAAWGRLEIMDGVSPRAIELFFQTLAGALGPERVPC